MKQTTTFSRDQINDYLAWARHSRESGYIVKVSIKGGKIIVERRDA